MATINYTLRIDETDKQQAEQVFKALGMTFATGINVYLKTVTRQQKIPFMLEIGQTPRMKLGEAFEEAQKESFINGMDNITRGEIDEIIAEERRKERGL
jgi:addiction module RelB/DinJ family antitoxin